MEANKKARGGARKGAGRKINVSGEKKKMQTIAMRPDIIRTLKTLDNYSAFVENAILKEFKKQGIKIEKKDAENS